MLDACANIKKTSYGYGVFVARPSKTANIEQSLVIGTQGTRSLTIFILADPA